MKKNLLLPLLFCAIGCLAAFNATAKIVSFGFSGTVTDLENPSNALPANITYDTPFTGIVTYDTSAILGGVDYDPAPDSGAYYFSVNGGLWLSVSMAGHSFDSTTPMAGDPYADIIIYNFNTPQDVFWVDASAPTIRMDGGPFPGTSASSGFSLTLYDNSGTVYANDSLPLTPPDLSAFPNLHQLAIYGQGSGNTHFSLSGGITEIGPPKPVLNIHPQPNQTAQLSWPMAAQGFILLQNTNLTAGVGWKTNSTPIVDTATAHTVNVPLTGSMFYRLKLP